MNNAKSILICLLLITVVAITQGQTTTPQTNPPNNPDAPEISFDKTVYDYGTIKKDTNGGCEFVFKNTGKSALILNNVSTSCGCTVPTWPREPILPGKIGTIKVVYDTKRLGPFNKTITVSSNAKNSTITLTIKGVVKE